jgi:hypothetical protein
MITTAAHPASEGYGLSNVLGTKGSEVMCAQHSTPFCGGNSGKIYRKLNRIDPGSIPFEFTRYPGTVTA